jgi:CsoR family transcriptional regulator, copper-sensing transcriptional repressor
MQATTRPTVMPPDKEALIEHLHRIEGQVRGIEKMLSEGRHGIDIITQVSAGNTALEAVALKILAEHVNHRVAGGPTSGDEEVAAEKSRGLLDAVDRFARTHRHDHRPAGSIVARAGTQR